MQVTTSGDVDGPPCIDRKSSSLHALFPWVKYSAGIICMHINLVLNLESAQLLKTQQLMIRLNTCIRNNESFKTRPILIIYLLTNLNFQNVTIDGTFMKQDIPEFRITIVYHGLP
jgi:hypothetical protein